MTRTVESMRELIAARADPRVDDALTKFGVSDPDVRLHCGMAHVDVDGDGRFYQPVDDGRPTIIVPVFDAYELIDLLAFDPRKPEQWWLRVGAVPLLGSDALGEQLLGKPLRVFKTPLAWLLAGLDGVVILDLQRAFPDLSAAQYGLAAENPTHERELRKALAEIATRRLPHVLVQALEREVA